MTAAPPAAGTSAPEPTAAGKASAWFMRTFTTPSGVVGGIIVAAVVVVAVVAPLLLMDKATTIDPANGLLGASWEHPFGTDELGRDVGARVLVATRLTLLLVLGALAISTVSGVLLGVGVAMLGDTPRKIFFQITSAATAFPAILLAILLASIVGRSGVASMIGLAVAGIPSTARLTLNLASSVMSAEYVQAAQIVGVPKGSLLRRYLLPNIAEPLVTLTVISAGQSLVALSALSFVGIGVQDPQFDWGRLLNGAMATMYTSPLGVVAPALAVVVTGVGFNLLGEAMGAGIDPRVRVALADRRARRLAAKAGRKTSPQPGAAAGTAAPRPVAGTTRPTTDAAVRAQVAASPDIAVGVSGLTLTTGEGPDQRTLVDDVTVLVRRGERLGIVGESGSGKTLTLSALAGLVPAGVSVDARLHQVAGTDLTGARKREADAAIGARLPMIFQDPMASLNPALRIGEQLVEKIRVHTDLGRREATEKAVAALEAVGIENAAARMCDYPHEFSGGMRQRVMIAMATLVPADAILADEPTTALDVSVQAQVVDLLLQICQDAGTALVLVSHDLALVSQVCERIIVMYGGHVLEEGTTEQILTAPQHPYTRMLLGAVPDIGRDRSAPLLTVPRGTPADVTDLAAWEELERRSARAGASAASMAAGPTAEKEG